MNPATY